MGISTAEVQEQGVRKVLEIAERRLRQRDNGLFRGLILTGSAARGEATILRHDSRFIWLSDVECLVPIAHKRDLPQARSRLSGLSAAVDREMADCGHDVEVELTPAPVAYFTTLEPHLFSVELKSFGRQIFGDRQYLDLIPPLDRERIGPEEAWRLLSNRLVEDLDRKVAQRPRRVIDRIYGDVKLAVDVLTAFAILSDNYAPSYGERYVRRDEILAGALDLGLDAELVEHYRRILDEAMQFKTAGTSGSPWSRYPAEQLWEASSQDWYGAEGSAWAHWNRLSDVATAAWLVHLRLLTGTPADPGLRSALRPLGKVHGIASTLRGWLAAIVKSPPHRRMKLIRQAVRLGRLGSPRALTYGCAWALLTDVYPMDMRTQWVSEHLPADSISAQSPNAWEAQGQACTQFWREVLRLSVA